MPEGHDIAYAIHTAACTFLLDGEGVCQRVIVAPHARKLPKNAMNASRCVGAQYVASLDPSVPGCLVELPSAGLSMLFARVDERGRISLVRTDSVTRFESKRSFDPFASTSGVRTSAPELPTRPPTIRPKPTPRPGADATTAAERQMPVARTSRPRQRDEQAARDEARPYERTRHDTPTLRRAPQDDPDARTVPVQRLRPEQIKAAFARRSLDATTEAADLRATARLAGGRKRDR